MDSTPVLLRRVSDGREDSFNSDSGDVLWLSLSTWLRRTVERVHGEPDSNRQPDKRTQSRPANAGGQRVVTSDGGQFRESLGGKGNSGFLLESIEGPVKG
jgi:hypothetical protein